LIAADNNGQFSQNLYSYYPYQPPVVPQPPSQVVNGSQMCSPQTDNDQKEKTKREKNRKYQRTYNKKKKDKEQQSEQAIKDLTAINKDLTIKLEKSKKDKKMLKGKLELSEKDKKDLKKENKQLKNENIELKKELGTR